MNEMIEAIQVETRVVYNATPKANVLDFCGYVIEHSKPFFSAEEPNVDIVIVFNGREAYVQADDTDEDLCDRLHQQQPAPGGHRG